MFFKKKKKIEELERELKNVKENFERDRGAKLELQNELRRLKESTNNQLIHENKVLINWVEKILDVANICKANEGLELVNIPIMENKIKPYNSNWELTDVQRKEIIIPSIRFTTIDRII